MMVAALLRRRPLRRAAVIAVYGGYAASAVAWIAAGDLRAIWTRSVVVTGFAVTFAALSLLFHGTRFWRWGNAPAAHVDEYELASRNAAYRTAYMVLATAGMLGLLVWRIATDAGAAAAPAFATGLVQDLAFWGWFLAMLTLPSTLLAWSAQTTRRTEPPRLAAPRRAAPPHMLG